MHLADKLGELDNYKNISGYKILKIDGKFVITVKIRQKNSVMAHNVITGKHDILIDAVSEAIELFREHLTDCSLC